MNANDAEFLKKLQATFYIEAEEHLQAISSGLLALEKESDEQAGNEIVASIFREAHSLKGAARAVNAADIESICQSLESVFAAWKGNGAQRSPESFDPLHKAITAVGKMLPTLEGAVPGLNVEEKSAVLNGLADCASTHSKPASDAESTTPTESTSASVVEPNQEDVTAAPADPSPLPVKVMPIARTSPATPRAEVQPFVSNIPSRARPAAAAPETLRIAAAKLDALLLQAEEMLAVKLTTNQRGTDLRQIVGMLGRWDREWTKMAPEMRAACETLAKAAEAHTDQFAFSPIAKLGEFFEWSGEQMKSLQSQLGCLMKAFDHDRRAAAGMVDALLSDTKNLLMLPSSTLLEPFPKMVRDLSRDQEKDVDLVVSGDDVEIDKRVLNDLRDPLLHLLRNAVDHGIESPSQRVRAGKPPRGTIRVAVSQVDGNKIEIVVSDDGKGINPADVNEAAVRRGVISAEQGRTLGEQEALWLIFRPEVSTSAMITEISGRGLGMSIVKETVERIGGRISLETRPGQGTTFHLLLPLTLATFRGLLVHSAGQPFIIPTANVERVVSIKADQVRTVEMRETIRLSGRILSLVRLDAVLGLPSRPAHQAPPSIQVVVLTANEKAVAFSVDEILNEQEVLVKRLGTPLVRVRNVAGATVLGTGKAVPILNVDDLLKSAVRGGAPIAALEDQGAAAPRVRHKSVLVVEDSITARMLIKNILESAGHLVKTAVDGVDALTLIKTETFDLVVSDVEMPRMNGFELTERIRADARFAELPVVLVTALASREHRERGVEAGANAYIVKGSFDQSNLLDVVKRLL